jgi:hypothetical protein
MFLKKMRLLSFIRKKISSKKPKTMKEKLELIRKKEWLNGEGPQTD